jgi:hypothetical protein
VLHQRLGHGFSLLHVCRRIQGQARLVRGALGALDTAVMLALVPLADGKLPRQRGAKARQSRGQITGGLPAEPAGIAIGRAARGTPIPQPGAC